MKYKVTPKYKGIYKSLPYSRNDMISRRISQLCRIYKPKYDVIKTKEFYDVDNILNTYNKSCEFIIQSKNFVKECVSIAESEYMFKALRFYDYLQSEIMCKVRAKRFTRHVIRKQIFGK